MTIQIQIGDSRQLLKAMPADSVHCVVTSPPYWGLRDYGVDGQIGMEDTPEDFVATMLNLFREVHRVLRPDGTCWVNLGDSYAGSWGAQCRQGKNGDLAGRTACAQRQIAADQRRATGTGSLSRVPGLKEKDLVGIPWRVAFALQADGWWLRSDVIWHKPNAMPESVTDRPVRAHEYIFLFTKSERYFYDADATRTPAKAPEANTPEDVARAFNRRRATTIQPRQDSIASPPPVRSSGNLERKTSENGERGRINNHIGYSFPWAGNTALKRDVWTVASKPFQGAHFATFPPDLIEPCILAGTSARGACPTCGSPWIRQVERNFVPQSDVSPEAAVRGSGDQKPMDASNGWQGHPRGSTEAKTIGWAPTCSCAPLDPVPCLVLDPFGGAGTTGLVADRMGRDAILLELNSAYAEMARDRLKADGGMMTTVDLFTTDSAIPNKIADDPQVKSFPQPITKANGKT